MLMCLSYPVLKGNKYVYCCTGEFHITVIVCALLLTICVPVNTSPVAYCRILKKNYIYRFGYDI